MLYIAKISKSNQTNFTNTILVTMSSTCPRTVLRLSQGCHGQGDRNEKVTVRLCKFFCIYIFSVMTKFNKASYYRFLPI